MDFKNCKKRGRGVFPHTAMEGSTLQQWKAALCRHSPKAAFAPCKAPSCFLPHPTLRGPAPLLSLASLEHFGPAEPRWLICCSVPPLHLFTNQGVLIPWGVSLQHNSCCSKPTFHVAWAHIPQVLFQGSLDICFGLQLD